MCALEGFLYAFGGWVGEDIGGSIERYDPSTNQWTLTSKMPEPRFSMGICTYSNLIFLVGGCTHSRRHMQELVAYDPVGLFTQKLNTSASLGPNICFCVYYIRIDAFALTASLLRWEGKQAKT